MKLSKLLPLFGLVFVFAHAQAQFNPTAAQQNYWNYRNRLKTQFIKIGTERGNSIPLASRWDNVDATFCDVGNGRVNWGDAPAFLGHYIAMLATEYKLLKDEGRDVQPTLNELYYALEAFNRLDKFAEILHQQTPLLDGMFARDDVNADTYTNWATRNNTTMTGADNYKKEELENGVCKVVTQVGLNNNLGSIDHIVTLFVGLKFVIKFVDDIPVQPLPTDPVMPIKTEAINIVDRIMDYLVANHQWTESANCDINTGPNFNLNKTANWRLFNPANNKPLNNEKGGVGWLFAYPLAKAAGEMTGENYYIDPYYHQAHINSICLPQVKSGTIHMLNTNGITKPSCQRVFESMPEIANGTLAAMELFFGDKSDGLETAVFDTKQIQNNINIILPLAMLSRGWDFSDIQHYCNINGYDVLSLMYKVLYDNENVSIDQQLWEDILSTAPTDFNPYRGFSNNWSHSTRWQHPRRAQLEEQWGFFNGVDYMLAHNLYRMAFSTTSTSTSIGNFSECSCDNSTNQNIVFPETDSEGRSWNLNLKWTGQKVLPTTIQAPLVKEIKTFHDDYKEKGIVTYDYLSNDYYQVNNNGKLLVKGGAKLCGNNSLMVASNGEVVVGSDIAGEEGLLLISNNTTLDIEGDGILTIKDNSKVIIEEGAALKIYSGAIIQLNGENAVLEIRGKLELMPNAIFRPTGSGHVLFNIQNAHPSIAPYNVAAGASSQMIFESTANPKPFNLKLANNTILNPQPTLQLFKVDGVKVQMGISSEIFVNNTFEIQNSLIESDNGFGFTFTTLNFTPTIHHNTFVGGRRALTFIGKDNGRDIKIRYNTFQSVVNTIVMYDHSAHIAGNSFTDNCGGVFAGATLNYLVPPTQGGLYKGRLRMELNRFENSSALEIHGAYYPSAIVGGNVAHYTPTGSNATRTDITVAIEKAHATLKCNWFENQGEAVYHGMSGNLNMSTQRQSHYAIGSGGAYVTGGNNFFKTNLRSIVVNSQNIQSPFTLATYDINQGQNSFTAIPSNSRTSLIVDRRWNIQSMNYALNPSGDMEINGNFWSPILSTSNYPSGFPSNVIERNYYISNHFNIYEYQSPDFIVGTNTAVSQTCPISVWNDALSDPENFDPISSSAFGFNYGSTDPVKVYFDRPFGLSGEGYTYPPTTVNSGTYSGQGFGTAFHSALTGMTVQTTDANNNTYYVPNPTGMLNMANLLISTAGHSTTNEVEIYSFGYKAYLQCLARAAAVDVFEGNTILQDAQISAALEVFTAIENNNQQFVTSMPERYYQTRFTIGIDKLHLYRLFDSYTNAQTVLSSLASFVEGDEIATVNYLSCHVENERKLFNNEISWIEYRNNLNNCGMLYGSQTLISNIDSIGWGDSTQSSGSSSSSTPYLNYTISPNPAMAQTSVIIDMNVDATVTITVFNKFGQQVVATQSLGTLLANSQTTATVTLSGLPADTYNMVVYAGGVPYVQHFIKLTE